MSVTQADAVSFISDYGLQLSSWGLFLATLALVIVTAIQSRDNRAMRKQVNTIEEARERDRLMDRQQAALVASIHEVDSFKYAVEIANRGKGGARGITVKLDGKDVSAMPNHNPHPLTVLGSGAVFVYSLPKPGTNVPYPKVVEVEWTDDSILSGHFTSSVSVIR